MYLRSINALRTLSRLQVFLSSTKALDRVGTTDSSSVKKTRKAIMKGEKNMDMLG
jgi:hypothetical protein